MTLFPEDPKKTRQEKRAVSREQSRLLVMELAATLKRMGYLPMDRGLKSILGAHITLLLNEGYSFETIRAHARDIALNDNYKVQRLAYLVQRVRNDANRIAEQEHHVRKLSEGPMAKKVAAMMPTLKKMGEKP